MERVLVYFYVNVCFAFLSFEPNIEISLKICTLTFCECGELISKWTLNMIPLLRVGGLLLSDSQKPENAGTLKTITASCGLSWREICLSCVGRAWDGGLTQPQRSHQSFWRKEWGKSHHFEMYSGNSSC